MRAADQIKQRLESLPASHLELINESRQHGGYVDGAETHFKLVAVSTAFEGLRRVARHQKVYAELSDLLTSGGGQVHALALHLYTPSEFQDQSPASPNCLGGSKQEQGS